MCTHGQLFKSINYYHHQTSSHRSMTLLTKTFTLAINKVVCIFETTEI